MSYYCIINTKKTYILRAFYIRMSLASFIFAAILITNVGQNCLTSSDEYAVEALIPTYDMQKILSFTELVQGHFAYLSKNEDLIVLLTEEENGLSVKLQMQTILTTSQQPHIRIANSQIKGTLNPTHFLSYIGWDVECTDTQCTFSTPTRSITIEGKENPVVTFEIDEALPVCDSSCGGVCIPAPSPACLPRQQARELETVLRLVNITTSADELIKGSRLVGTQGIVLTDIKPLSQNQIDWEEVMGEELAFLKEQEAIELSNANIQSIASLADPGRAGENYRIVEEAGEWTYYDQTDLPPIPSNKQCLTYATKESTTKPAPRLFYLVPIILTFSALILFIILIVIARTVSKHNKKI